VVYFPKYLGQYRHHLSAMISLQVGSLRPIKGWRQSPFGRRGPHGRITVRGWDCYAGLPDAAFGPSNLTLHDCRKTPFATKAKVGGTGLFIATYMGGQRIVSGMSRRGRL